MKGNTYQINHTLSFEDSDIFKPMNAKTNSSYDNLVDLMILNEPEILHCLESRFKEQIIYTYTGPILIAINPYKEIHHLYDSETLLEYCQDVDHLRPSSPHIYDLAHRVYHHMMQGIQESPTTPCNQSVLISGESGAGKTESTKHILQFLTIVGSSPDHPAIDHFSIMERILASNPILESFGNAKTLRNNNSSRFGKFIELKFDSHGILIGGHVRTYMLEKVRVVSQQIGERNYHIFYMMAEGGTEQEKHRWGIWNSSLNSFHYLNHVNILDNGILNDRANYHALEEAFLEFNFTQEKDDLLNTVAAIMHIGQIRFEPTADGEGSLPSMEDPTPSHLIYVSRLLGVSLEDTIRCLTSRIITIGGSQIIKTLTAALATESRDALARFIYSSLFEWLIQRINSSLVQSNSSTRAEIGILDIFGFEYFQNNSLQQLCINYAVSIKMLRYTHLIFC